MNWKKLLAHWNRTYIQIVDVQYRKIHTAAERDTVPLRSNMIYFQVQGRTVCHLDDEIFHADGHYVMHAGKGQQLEIALLTESAVVYQIYYHSWPIFPHDPQSYKAESAAMSKPFGFAPLYPLPLQERLNSLYMEWSRMTTLSRLNAKGQLYQIVYDILLQADKLAQGEGWSVADQMIRYIHEHARQPITLERLAAQFHYNARYLASIFKRRTGYSPIDYVIQLRMHQARKLLRSTDIPVKKLARHIGYDDVLYFTRLFKKTTGMTPRQYRLEHRASEDADCPYTTAGSCIESSPSIRYIQQDNDNHYQLQTEKDGEEHMFQLNSVKKKVAIMGMAVLLGACSNGASEGKEGSSNGNQPAPGAAQEQPAEGGFPRTFVDHTGKEIVLEEQPQRIAVGHFAEMEYFFALDVPPVASPLAAEILQEFKVTIGDYAAEADVADLGDVMAPDMEKLLEAEPDLIIGSVGLHEEVYDQLNKIAPVVMLESTGDWQQTLNEYARLIGKEDKAAAYIKELTAALEEAKQALASYKDETTALLRFSGPAQFGLMGTGGYQFYYSEEEGLGFQAPEGYPASWEVTDLEGLFTLNPEHLIIFEYGSEYESKLKEMEQDSVWNRLTAVRQGNVHFVDIAAATNGPFALKFALETLVASYTK